MGDGGSWRENAEKELRILREMERRRHRDELEGSLYLFLREAWAYMDPAPWQDDWCIEAVAEHLQAVVDGEIQYLIINIPPRLGKSSICSVALPAWCWAQRVEDDKGNPIAHGPNFGPGCQFMHASYAEKLSLRDSVRCRRLIKSRWYQKHWGDRFSLLRDQDSKTRFVNDKGGERLITSIGGTATGEGFNIGVIDDPNAANEVESEATIEATNDWWDGTMSTRRNDPNTGAFIIIQQRLGEDDLTGHVLSQTFGNWTHLVLPMRYEAERSFTTVIGWKDPRTREGELLSRRFNEASVELLESSLGPWRAAGQLQQRPEPKGGGIIKRAWWRLWEEPAFPPMDFIMASLDTAFTEKTENDYSAMTVWGVFTSDIKARAGRIVGPDGRPIFLERVYDEGSACLMLMYAWAKRLEFPDLVPKTLDTCRKLKVDVLMIENKAAGISVAQEIRRNHANELWSTQLYDPKSTDKIARLHSVANIFAKGMVFAPDMTWAEEVIDQTTQFPKGKHDDLVDTVSQAIRRMREMGLLTMPDERLAEIEASKEFHGRPAEPLYPV